MAEQKKGSDTFEVKGLSPYGPVGVRTKDGKDTEGVLVKVEEGKPVVGDLVKLKPRDGSDTVYDVEVLYEGKKGPSRANTPQYRTGYEAVFGKQKKGTKADYLN